MYFIVFSINYVVLTLYISYLFAKWNARIETMWERLTKEHFSSWDGMYYTPVMGLDFMFWITALTLSLSLPIRSLYVPHTSQIVTALSTLALISFAFFLCRFQLSSCLGCFLPHTLNHDYRVPLTSAQKTSGKQIPWTYNVCKRFFFTKVD